MQAMPVRIFLVLFILALICPSSLIALRKEPPPEIKKESPTPPEILKSNTSQRESADVLPGLIAAPERRTALVIGNGAYETGRLKNPVNDATDMAATLKRMGFNVILKTNASQREMDGAVREFGRSLARSDVGLFFFAGHGIQTGGSNYLIPVGARIEKEEDVRFEAIDAGRILSEMDHANNGLNIVLLDACRNNPFARSFRSESRGLAIIGQVPRGAFISYATAPGDVARDGDGRNSPYTESLLEYMQIPGIPIETVFKRVRLKLDSETGGKQVPWESSSLKGDFYFVPKSASKAADAVPGGKVSVEREESPVSAVSPLVSDQIDDSLIKEKREELQRMAAEIEKVRKILSEDALKKKTSQYLAKKVEYDRLLLAMAKRPSQPTTGETGRDSRFIANNNGTVSDNRTNLMWAAKDNGSNINWQGAKSYCENYRGGGYTDWRMPTQDELEGLYDTAKAYKSDCGYDVHLTELVRLTCYAPWASETRGSDAALFIFSYGKRYWSPQSSDSVYRALPVRSGK
ncbi:MAG: caspase family protein [Deltaproteobacteria bacterium]|nr:caspase family protein [Deltaproteobacteria bacterium]